MAYTYTIYYQVDPENIGKAYCEVQYRIFKGNETVQNGKYAYHCVITDNKTPKQWRALLANALRVWCRSKGYIQTGTSTKMKCMNPISDFVSLEGEPKKSVHGKFANIIQTPDDPRLFSVKRTREGTWYIEKFDKPLLTEKEAKDKLFELAMGKAQSVVEQQDSFIPHKMTILTNQSEE